MKILNMERLKRKLARIPDNVKRRAQADLMLAGREINMLQRSLAPIDDGTLRASIRTEPLTDGTVGVEVKAGGPTTTKAYKGRASYEREVTIGQGNNRGIKKGGAFGVSYDYALAQELGTKDMAPNPFFYPGYKARKRRALSRVRQGWKRSLKEAASDG